MRVTSIERTAHPRFKRLPSVRELHVFLLYPIGGQVGPQHSANSCRPWPLSGLPLPHPHYFLTRRLSKDRLAARVLAKAITCRACGRPILARC